MSSTVIMDENSVSRTLSRLAHEIIEDNPDLPHFETYDELLAAFNANMD